MKRTFLSCPFIISSKFGQNNRISINSVISYPEFRKIQYAGISGILSLIINQVMYHNLDVSILGKNDCKFTYLLILRRMEPNILGAI